MACTVCSRSSFSIAPNSRMSSLFLRPARMSLHLLDRHHQTMRLDLLVVKLGFFARLRGHDAFPLLMHLEHVFGGLLFRERQHFHEHEDDISHEVNWIVP